MSLKVDISADSRYPVDRRLLRETVARFLDKKREWGEVAVSITVCGDRKMRKLNNNHRQRDETAGVLSFPLYYDGDSEKKAPAAIPFPGQPRHLGDIVVSWPQARDLAVRANRLISDVAADLVEHGLLHLLGIHHPE